MKDLQPWLLMHTLEIALGLKLLGFLSLCTNRLWTQSSHSERFWCTIFCSICDVAVLHPRQKVGAPPLPLRQGSFCQPNHNHCKNGKLANIKFQLGSLEPCTAHHPHCSSLPRPRRPDLSNLLWHDGFSKDLRMPQLNNNNNNHNHNHGIQDEQHFQDYSHHRNAAPHLQNMPCLARLLSSQAKERWDDRGVLLFDKQVHRQKEPSTTFHFQHEASNQI